MGPIYTPINRLGADVTALGEKIYLGFVNISVQQLNLVKKWSSGQHCSIVSLESKHLQKNVVVIHNSLQYRAKQEALAPNSYYRKDVKRKSCIRENIIFPALV